MNKPTHRSRAAQRAFAVVAVLLFGCATAESSPPPPQSVAPESDPLFDDDFDLDGAADFPDPMEEMNRVFLKFNVELDRWLFDPITRAYRFVVPDPVERGVRHVFKNLQAPSTIVNDLLQLEWKDASVATGRFVVNSTVGLAGVLEVAEPMGLEPHTSDFGQTLTLAGVPSGAYLVLPILGPSTVRDGAGDVIDTFLDPTSYVLPLGGAGQLFYGGGAGLSLRAEHYESLQALKESSVDFYAALRSAWCQNRNAEIWARREHRRKTME